MQTIVHARTQTGNEYPVEIYQSDYSDDAWQRIVASFNIVPEKSSNKVKSILLHVVHAELTVKVA